MSRRVSCYVTAFNNAQCLQQCIDSIKAQTHPIHEILTVEDGHSPDDASLEIARANGVRILTDHQGVNKGLSASSNTALEHAEGEFFLKIDGDVSIAPFYLEKCLRYFDDVSINAVGGRMTEIHVNSVQGVWRSRFLMQNAWGPQLTKPKYLAGFACVYRTGAVRQVGGWNEKHRISYQDVSLSLKLGQPTLVYDPECWARHLRKQTMTETIENSWRWGHDPEEEGYGSLASAARYIMKNKSTAFQGFVSTIQNVMPELCYPSFLYFPWSCMEDVGLVARLKNCDPGEAAATQKEMAFIVRQNVEESQLPKRVKHRIWSDLSPWAQKFSSKKAEEKYLEVFRKHKLTPDQQAGYCLETSVMALEAGGD